MFHLISTNRKFVSSFSIDLELLKEFEKTIPKYSKSLLIVFLIKQFLNKKSPERASILSQAMTEKPLMLKKGVSNV